MEMTFVVHSPTGIDVLHGEASTSEAEFDTQERNYAPSCILATRKQYVYGIINWANPSNGNQTWKLLNSVCLLPELFRCAVFSQEDPHFLSVFASTDISYLCYSARLPISRETDKEIKLLTSWRLSEYPSNAQSSILIFLMTPPLTTSKNSSMPK
ncbi:hypothetical protein D9756_006707 [Leucocoprinus leucothites]|uniref:Uncharacterized protein n=1 Tax=Leucocoprinus leucothites TaxID=201217 RepID=A0A8H5G1S6_9AGAR|nr:hypothetical protein D9756_006707 [Leucoagaricus leucothites]